MAIAEEIPEPEPAPVVTSWPTVPAPASIWRTAETEPISVAETAEIADEAWEEDTPESGEPAELVFHNVASFAATVAEREPNSKSEYGDPCSNEVPDVGLNLALLERNSQISEQSMFHNPEDDREKSVSTGRDPFEQARKALYGSRFDVRVIHNNGDPSDRDLI